MSKPSKKAANCNLDLLPDLTRGSATDVKTISLFEQKRVRGFWPCYNDVNGTRELTVSDTLHIVFPFTTQRHHSLYSETKTLIHIY